MQARARFTADAWRSDLEGYEPRIASTDAQALEGIVSLAATLHSGTDGSNHARSCEQMQVVRSPRSLLKGGQAVQDVLLPAEALKVSAGQSSQDCVATCSKYPGPHSEAFAVAISTAINIAIAAGTVIMVFVRDC